MTVLLLAEQSSAAPHARVETIYNSTILVNESDLSGWSFGAIENRLALLSNSPGWHWKINLAHVAPHGRLAARDTDGLTGKLFAAQPFFQVAVRTESPGQLLGVSVAWTSRSDNIDEGTAGLCLRPVRQIVGSIELGRENWLPALGEFRYDNEGGRVDIGSVATFSRTVIDAAFDNGLTLRSSMKSGNADPDRSFEAMGSDPAEFQLAADGMWREGMLSIEHRVSSGWIFRVSYARWAIDGRLQGYQSGRRFVYFGQIKLDVRRWSLGIGRERWQLGLHRGTAAGDLAGVVEAWPFVSGLALFLGERRHLVGKGEADWKRADLAIGPIRFGRLRLDTRLDYYRVTPTVVYVSWRPLFLGFGIDDLQRGSLNLRRADIARLELRAAMNWGWVKLDMLVSQLAPLSMAYHQPARSNMTPHMEPRSGNPGDGIGGDRRHQGFSFGINLSAHF